MTFLTHTWNSGRSKWQIILTAALLVGFVAAVVCSRVHSMPFSEMWPRWMDLYVAFSTILLAAFIWYNERKQEWSNNLPKKLNVKFYRSGDILYEIKNAPLAGESDARAWGQQIGMQMNGNERLELRSFNLNPPSRGVDTAGNHVMNYNLVIWLEDKAENSRKDAKSQTEPVGTMWEYGDDGCSVTPTRPPV